MPILHSADNDDPALPRTRIGNEVRELRARPASQEQMYWLGAYFRKARMALPVEFLGLAI